MKAMGRSLVFTTMILLAAFFAMATQASAALVLSDGFEQGVALEGRAVYKGQYVAGFSGDGWKSTAKVSDMTAPEYIQYNLPDGFFKSEGTFSFRLKRDALKPTEYGEDAIFQVMDADYHSLFLVVIRWIGEGEYWEGLPVLRIVIPDQISEGKLNPYGGEYVALDNKVKVGDWVHLAITWGDKINDQNIYLNGKKLSYKSFDTKARKSGISEAAPLGAFLANAKYIRVGAETLPFGDTDNAFTPMNDSVIDELKVYDTAFNPYEVAPPAAVASIIADSPWGGENKVSWNAAKGATSYEIFRSLDGTFDYTIPVQVTGNLEYLDKDVIAGIEYFYSVVALNQAGLAAAPSDVVSTVAIMGDGPSITSISAEPNIRPLRPGDVLTVTVKGASGTIASADFLGFYQGVKLLEQGSTGIYTGSYEVTEADIAESRGIYRVVANLTDSYATSRLAGPEVTFVSIADLNDKTPPNIASVTHDAFSVAGFSGALVAGDILTVTLKGETQGYASFNLVGVVNDIQMAEVEEGLYRGSYEVTFDDEGKDVAVEGVLADIAGNETKLAAAKSVDFDTRVRMLVTARDGLLPADSSSKTRIIVKAEDANGDDILGHELSLTLSTTEEYTGVVGGGKVEDKFASADDVDDLEIRWDGITDSFGEVAATYTAGFAAKTALIVAKDLTTGDVGAGWLNTYVSSTIAIQLTERKAAMGSSPTMTMTINPGWLTADGRSKARVRVYVKDASGIPVEGTRVDFSVGGDNGSIKLLRGITDATGMAEADYRAGTVAGFVTITATADRYEISTSAQIELRSDAPAKIDLVASVMSMPADGHSTSDITAKVSDINDNPNTDTPLSFNLLEGSGDITPADTMTDLDGVAKATFTAGRTPGQAILEARHTSRAPSEDELRRIFGTVFVPRYYEGQERDRIRVDEWLVEAGDEVTKGQPIAKLDIDKVEYLVTAPETGIFTRKVRFKRDRVEVGETIGVVEIDPDVWVAKYTE